MDEEGDREHGHPSKYARESDDDDMLGMNNDDESKPKCTRNGEDESAYYSRIVQAEPTDRDLKHSGGISHLVFLEFGPDFLRVDEHQNFGDR